MGIRCDLCLSLIVSFFFFGGVEVFFFFGGVENFFFFGGVEVFILVFFSSFVRPSIRPSLSCVLSFLRCIVVAFLCLRC